MILPWPFLIPPTLDGCLAPWSTCGWHPTMDSWAQRAKGSCAAGETLHRNECKHMTWMCCIEWCSFQGPTTPAQDSLHCQLENVELFVILPWPFLIPPTLDGCLAPWSTCGWHPTMDCWAQRAKGSCAAGETLHRNECKHIVIYSPERSL